MSASGIGMKRMLADTMKEMIAEKNFTSISVKSICESCGINRKSFYYHYRDKFDLVNDIYNMEFLMPAMEKKYVSVWNFVDDLCIYIDKNRRFYRAAFAVEGQNSFKECFCESLEPMLFVVCERQSVSQREVKTLAAYMAKMVCAAFEKWLEERNPMSAIKFSSMICSFFTGVSDRFLGVGDYSGMETRQNAYSYN